jgi:hypothetical protein
VPFAALLAVTAALAAQPAAAPRPHRFGVGASIVASTVGGGGAFRYWFGERVGVDVNVIVFRPRVSADDRATVAQLSPSVIVMLREPDPDRDPDVLPYVGGGVTWTHDTFPARRATTLAPDTRAGGVGGQVLGGVELTFADQPSIALSATVMYSKRASRAFQPFAVDGVSWFVAVHYYVW